MIRVSLQHQTAVSSAACVRMSKWPNNICCSGSHQWRHKQSTAISQTGQVSRWNGTESWWDEKRDQSTLVDGATKKKRSEWERRGRAVKTLLLPKSIGDSQPRDRRLPASSLHSATTGKKRRAELIDKTCSGERRMKTAFFSEKRSNKGKTESTFSCASGVFSVQSGRCFACTTKQSMKKRVIYEWHRGIVQLKALQSDRQRNIRVTLLKLYFTLVKRVGVTGAVWSLHIDQQGPHPPSSPVLQRL